VVNRLFSTADRVTGTGSDWTYGRINAARAVAGGRGVSDRSPPETKASLSPQPNVHGWNNSDVTVQLTATDNAGGSGVQSMTYSASGAQTFASKTVQQHTVSIPISAEGQTTITFTASDNVGNVETPNKTISIKLDKTT